MDIKKLLNAKSSSVNKFKELIEKESKQGFEKDNEGFWQPTVDQAGNGHAVIRFLPTPHQDGEDGLPWVKYWSHGFKGPTGIWYIENSLTTLGQPDPVSEYNTKLWGTGTETNKKIVREQKRKLSYVSNIYVVSDPKNPENEGKVFKYRYGKKIFEKIDEAINPQKYDEFSDKESIDPFHFVLGANFKLKIRNKDGYRNYDKSEFDEASPLLGGDAEKLEAVWKSEYSLKEIIGPDKFKDYATLKQKLDKVLGIDTSLTNPLGESNLESVSKTASAGLRASTVEDFAGSGSDNDPDLFKHLAEAEDE